MKPPLIVSKPCPKKWAELTGDSVRRHCSECNLDVHNLSEMTPRQQQMLAASPIHVCIAYETDTRGNFISKRRFGWLSSLLDFPRAIAFFLLATLLPFLLSSCARMTLGKVGDSGAKGYSRVTTMGYSCPNPDSLKK